MSLPIDRHQLYTQLTRMLGVRQLVTEQPTLLADVQVVVNAFDVLQVARASESTLDLSPAAGTFVVGAVVPAGFRWIINHVYRGATAASSKVGFRQAASSATKLLTVAGTAEATVIGLSLAIDEGGAIGMLTTGNVGDTAIALHWAFTEMPLLYLPLRGGTT